jgi:hypothetical protein
MSAGWREPAHRRTMQARWVRRGVPVEMATGVKAIPFHVAPSPRMDREQWKERKEERNRLLENGAFVAAPVQDALELMRRGAMICPAFLVAKKGKTNRWRLVIDQRPLNKKCQQRGKVKLEGLEKIRHLGRPGMWAFSWDLADGYMNLEVMKAHQKRMTVDLGESMGADGEPISARNPRFVECAAISFGWVNSPYYFVKTMKIVQAALRRRGVLLTLYLDDGFVMVDSHEMGLRHREIVVEELARFGMKRQETKGQWEPVQDIEHLGMGVNLASGVFYVTKERRARLRRMGRDIRNSAARNKRWVNARWIAEFAGLALSTRLAVSQCRFRLRALYDVLTAAEVYRRGWSVQVKLDNAAMAALKWWVDQMVPEAGSSCTAEVGDTVGPVQSIWRPPVTQHVHSDASGEIGWGGTLGAVAVSSAAAGRDNGQFVRGIWSVQEQNLHITHKELLAVKKTIEGFREQLRGRHVVWWEDNQAVVGMLKHFATGSADRRLRQDLLEVIELLEAENIALQVRYIESLENPSDWWSRVVDKAEWQLRPALAHQLMHRWGQCQIDRFADSALTQLPRFNSAYPCRGSEHVDAFGVSWCGTHSWINPPWNKLDRIVYKLWQEPGASAVILLPEWPSATWWGLLERIAGDRVRVGLSQEDCIPGPLMRMTRGARPEPMLNSGWQMLLVFVPARYTQ